MFVANCCSLGAHRGMLHECRWVKRSVGVGCWCAWRCEIQKGAVFHAGMLLPAERTRVCVPPRRESRRRVDTFSVPAAVWRDSVPQGCRQVPGGICRMPKPGGSLAPGEMSWIRYIIHSSQGTGTNLWASKMLFENRTQNNPSEIRLNCTQEMSAICPVLSALRDTDIAWVCFVMVFFP